MHQFYCRAQRWSEPRREAAAVGGRGADEEGVKCLCTYKVESVSARKPKTNIQRIKVARQRMKARKKEQKGQQNR